MNIPAVLMLTGIFFSLSACTTKKSSPGPEIKIGVVLPLTGSQASFGIHSQSGIELALREYQLSAKNQRTLPIRLVILDDQSKSEEAAIATTKLITQNQVVAILGEISSSRTLAMAPIAQRYHIPLLTPGATNPEITKTGNYIFRTCFMDSQQGEALAIFAWKDLHTTRLTVLEDTKSDYSQGLAQVFRKKFTELGGKIILNQSYSGGDIDFKAQLTAIRAAQPQGIFIPGSYVEVGLIARQARELGMTLPLFGGDSWDSPQLTEIAGTTIEGGYFSNHYSSDDSAPSVTKFIKNYRSLFGKDPDGLAALGYDGARVLFEAIGRTYTARPEEIRVALSETLNFPGINGLISIDFQRNAVKPVSIIKISQGQFKFFKRM